LEIVKSKDQEADKGKVPKVVKEISHKLAAAGENSDLLGILFFYSNFFSHTFSRIQNWVSDF